MTTPARTPQQAEVGPWWFRRFQLNRTDEVWQFRDILMPPVRERPAQLFQGLEGRALEQACFESGFLAGTMGPALDEVADRPQHAEHTLFWQYPCRTEAAAWEAHQHWQSPRRIDDDIHVYLGLPWATWIDRIRKKTLQSRGLAELDDQQRLLAVRLSGFRLVLSSMGLRLRVHTVCQHIDWLDLIPVWRRIGVTDLWLSHCPEQERVEGLHLHPWRLFAVNVEDPGRRADLTIGRDPGERGLLASFIGGYAPNYLSAARLHLRTFAKEPGFLVDVTGGWHFESVVYGSQVRGQAASDDSDLESVRRYNRILSDSVFALCPPGTGANTLRLWEALATGAIPVLFEPAPRLPRIRDPALPPWESAVVHLRDHEFSDLPVRLRAMPLAERRARQKACMTLFEAVRWQTCV